MIIIRAPNNNDNLEKSFCFITESRLRVDTDLVMDRPVFDPNTDDMWYVGAIICSSLYNHSTRSELPFTVAGGGCSNCHFHHFCVFLIGNSKV